MSDVMNECEHVWGFEPLRLSTNVCDPKPVVCWACGKRRAWRRADKGKLPTHPERSASVGETEGKTKGGEG